MKKRTKKFHELVSKRDALIHKIRKKEIAHARKNIGKKKTAKKEKAKQEEIEKMKKIKEAARKKLKEKEKSRVEQKKKQLEKKRLEKIEKMKKIKEAARKKLKEKENKKLVKKNHKKNIVKKKQPLKPIPQHTIELENLRKEVAKIVTGQEKIVEGILRALLANGHVLLEGVPGIAKTLLIRALAEAVGCKFSRIQFTVDLLPTDITGITTYTPGKGFETIKGPIFANFIIADEVNRAPPKTQSALLEAMQEKQVTIGRNTYPLEPPFFVMANNNPIESSGTYKLPEAQMDRFLFKLKMHYPKIEEEETIIDRNITLFKFEDFKIKRILSPGKVIRLQKITKDMKVSPQIKKYIVKIVDVSRNPKKYGLKAGKYVEWGGSPRASISLYIGAKADAVLKGQKNVTPQNVKNVAYDALRHRILLNYAGQAENIDTDKIIDEILTKVKVP